MENYITIISSVISGVFGGGFVAVLNYMNSRRKLEAESATRSAEVEKLQAEAEKTRAETETIRGNMEFQAQEIGWLKLVITLIISEHERKHLEYLVSDEPFVAEVKKGTTFDSELRHLLTLTFIERLPGKGMRSLYKSGTCNLKEHLSITDQGRKYLKMVSEISD